jgi:hypothetical protein
MLVHDRAVVGQKEGGDDEKTYWKDSMNRMY